MYFRLQILVISVRDIRNFTFVIGEGDLVENGESPKN